MSPIANYGLPSGLTGAVAGTRFAGATVSGAPVSGTFDLGDYVVGQDGAIWICTLAGSPGTWVQIAQPTGSGTLNGNEGQACLLTNAVSPGDAGNRSDHFLGDRLGTQWTIDPHSGAPLSQVANSSAAANNPTSPGAFYSQPFTPSGDFIVESRVTAEAQATGGLTALMVLDGNFTVANGFMVGAQLASGQVQFGWYTFTSGTDTPQGTSIILNELGTSPWVFVRIQRTGTSLIASWSYDRMAWNVQAGVTKVFTATRLEIGYFSPCRGGIDFVDVVA